MVKLLPQQTTIGDIPKIAAELHGDKRAVVCADKELSFLEIDSLSRKFASGLVQKGVRPGDRVTLYSKNCLEWILAYYGIAKCGAVVNPINMMLTPKEVSYVVDDCEAKVLIGDAEKLGELTDLLERPGFSMVALGDPAPDGIVSFERFIKDGDPAFSDASCLPSEMGSIGYTSGTTGHPKGAMSSHHAIVFNVGLTASMHARNSGDVTLSALPLSHVYGNVVMQASLLTGGTFVCYDRFDAADVLQDVETFGATIIDAVPTMYYYMLDAPELGSTNTGSLTRCTVGGQTMPVAKMEEVEHRFGCPLIELWGMTELGGLGTTHSLYAERRLGSIGVPLPHVQMKIVDLEDSDKTLGPGEDGELSVKGPPVMIGYFGNEEATKETVSPDGWLCTGDIAHVDDDGYYYIVDRKKEMILTGGYNLYPSEIERVIASHPAVSMCAVVGFPDETKGEVPVAFVVLSSGETLTADELLKFCRGELASYKVPRLVEFVEDLPKTSSGKILRRELRKN